jgi:lipoprotein signal peptidase
MKVKLAILVLAIAMVGIDQWFKYAIGVALPHPASIALVLLGFIVFASFGCAACFFGWRKKRLGTLAGLILIFAGSLSNWLDRSLRGHVLTYLQGPGGSRFNIADLLIVIGTIVMIAISIIWLLKTLQNAVRKPQ